MFERIIVDRRRHHWLLRRPLEHIGQWVLLSWLLDDGMEGHFAIADGDGRKKKLFSMAAGHGFAWAENPLSPLRPAWMRCGLMSGWLE